MQVVVLLLVLATPAAAAAAFLALPAPVEAAVACGPDACFALAPTDASVRVEGGRAYSFLAADGAALAAGSLCGPVWLDVPAGAALLRVDPAPC